MPHYAYPAKSKESFQGVLQMYAQRRAAIREKVEELKQMYKVYVGELEAVEADKSTPLDYFTLDTVNSIGAELREASTALRADHEHLITLTQSLAKALPYATEDLLRRGNQILISINPGESQYLLCYDPEGVSTREYVVESVAYGQAVTEVTRDATRMLTIEQLLGQASVKVAMR